MQKFLDQNKFQIIPELIHDDKNDITNYNEDPFEFDIKFSETYNRQ